MLTCIHTYMRAKSDKYMTFIGCSILVKRKKNCIILLQNFVILNIVQRNVCYLDPTYFFLKQNKLRRERKNILINFD